MVNAFFSRMVRGGVGMFSLASIVPNQDQQEQIQAEPGPSPAPEQTGHLVCEQTAQIPTPSFHYKK